jgi:hypothetical protein
MIGATTMPWCMFDRRRELIAATRRALRGHTWAAISMLGAPAASR